MDDVTIREMEPLDVPSVGELFHAYRRFYEIDSQPRDCVEFISQRAVHRDSVIFVACRPGGTPMAFVQMYPLFSEVTLKRIWLLNDLYVNESERKNGVARRLMERCTAFVRESGGSEITLATAPTNLAAQSLYQKLGYVKNEQFWVYNLLV